MRKLSPSLSHQLKGNFVRPAYLVALDYLDDCLPLRYVIGTKEVTWNGYIWYGQDMDLKGFGWELKNTGKTSIDIQNVDSEMTRILLLNNVADRPVQVWIIYLYDRHIFNLAANTLSGSTSITVNDIIPVDISQTGSLYYGATNTLDNSYFVTYDSIVGKTFHLTTPLPVGLTIGHPVYILNTDYAIDDAVQIFDGVFDEIDLNEKTCTIYLSAESSNTHFSPRRRIIKNTTTEPKFSVLPQTGLKILWGTELFTLEKAVY